MEVLRVIVQLLSQLQTHDWFLLVVLSAASALLLRRALHRWANPFPPGPPALPIIGNLHLLGELPHQSLCKLSKTYGPLMGLRLGGVRAIVASSPEMAKEVLQTQDIAVAYRPRTAAAVHLCFDCADMAYAPLGPHWKFLRQLYATELFSVKRMESFRYVREGEAREMVREVKEEGAQRVVEVRRSLVTASNNINCRMVMGKKIKEVQGAAGEVDMHSLMQGVMHLTGVFYLGDYIPWLAWLDPNGYLKRMKLTGQQAKDMLQAVLDERRADQCRSSDDIINAGPQDLLDVLLAAKVDENTPMSDRHVMAAILDVFVGGSDTSATTVEWALADLINNPNAMKKLQEELDNVVGKERLVQECDIANLTYLGCVIKESMRLHPIAPFLIPRESMQECLIGGFKIQPRTRIYVNTWAISRDPKIWEKPLEFLPERFVDANIDLKSQNFDLLPFGSGRRRCPGWALGITNVHLLLATLVQAFTWECASGSTLDMSESFGLTVGMANPLCAIATPRLPMHLY